MALSPISFTKQFKVLTLTLSIIQSFDSYTENPKYIPNSTPLTNECTKRTHTRARTHALMHARIILFMLVCMHVVIAVINCINYFIVINHA